MFCNYLRYPILRTFSARFLRVQLALCPRLLWAQQLYSHGYLGN